MAEAACLPKEIMSMEWFVRGAPHGYSPSLRLVARIGPLLAGLVLALSGWSALGRAQATGATLSVHVLRTSAFPQNHIPYLEKTVTDLAQAQALYDAAQALPLPPKDAGAIHCPIDLGVAYDLAFTRGPTQAAWAIIKAGGCNDVTLNGVLRWALGQTHFWTTFANALGMSVGDLESPQARASGPYAPAPVRTIAPTRDQPSPTPFYPSDPRIVYPFPDCALGVICVLGLIILLLASVLWYQGRRRQPSS
jgi:hypothetical protein